MSILKRIEKLESEGYTYERNYNAGNHILEQALVKTWYNELLDCTITEVKSIEGNKITTYKTETVQGNILDY